MPIFIENPSGELLIKSGGGYVTNIEPDNLEIEFKGQDRSFFVSLLSNGNLKIVKVTGKETNSAQVKRLISSLANEIIIC